MDDEFERLRERRRQELLARHPAPPPVQGPAHVTQGDFERFVNENPIAMIDVWAIWCGPCRMTNPLVEQLAREWAGKIAVGKVDADSEPELVARFRVSGIPAFLFIKKGQLVGRLVGAQPKEAFDAVAVELLSNP